MKTLLCGFAMLFLQGCAVAVGRHVSVAGYSGAKNLYCFPCIEATEMFGWGLIWDGNKNRPRLGYVYDK